MSANSLASQPTFTDSRISGMILGAFVGDALSLSAHWIYDTKTISGKLGRLGRLADPLSEYHKGKTAGDYTHIGDQMWILQQSVAKTGGTFDADDFSQRWRAFWKDPATTAYRDTATKQTLEGLARGTALHEAGSLSEELAGAARCIPVIAAGLASGKSEMAVIESAQEQTALTHRGLASLHAAAFLARLSLGLVAGLDLNTALDGALCDSSQVIRDLGQKAAAPKLQALSTTDAIAQLGQACDLGQAFPSTLLLLTRYAHSFEEALVENVLAGGDSASRGIILGAILGYVHGVDAIPKAWRDGLHNLPC